MIRTSWYMMTYDIADPKRLRQVHYVIKKHGLAVQQSVFLVRGNEREVNALMDKLARKMNLREDDLRAYPINHPKHVWTNGPNPMADLPVLHFGSDNKNISKKRSKKKNSGWISRIFG